MVRARTLVALALAALLPASGCDRGSQPRQLGQPAPDFTLQDATRSVTLSHLRGHVVLLNFWASWCAPCLEELPSLEALHHQLPGLTILAISTDEDSSAYRNFLLDHHVDLLTLDDPTQSSNTRFGTLRFPESYVIDSAGIIRRKFIGPQDWNSPDLLAYFQKLAGHPLS